MGVRAKNIKGLFKDARTRTIIIITAIALVIGIVVGYTVLTTRFTEPATSAQVGGGPGNIQSIPGSFSPTAQYAKLQEQENLLKAQQATKTGGSAIPTIISATKTSEGQITTTPPGQPWQSGLGFQQLSQVEATNFTPKALALNNLKQNACDANDLTKAREQGASVAELRSAGCTAKQLQTAGYSVDSLQQGGFSACDLLSNNNINPKVLKDAGYSAGELKGVGFNACQLKEAGFSPQDLANAGYSAEELKGVGFSPDQLAGLAAPVVATTVSGLPPGVTEAALKAAGCSPDAIKQAKAQGVSAASLREIGCTAEELKNGGYSLQDLKNAGFTAGELLKAGYTANQLKAAGYSPADLLMAGLTPDDLKKAGFTDQQIKDGQSELLAAGLPPGVTIASLKAAGCGPEAIKQAKAKGVSAKILRGLGCTAAQLKAGGYNANDLKNAGFTAGELLKAGFTPQDLKNAGYTVAQLKAAGLSAKDLLNAGFTAKDLHDAGYSATQLKAAGVSENDIRGAGYSADDLSAAGIMALAPTPPPAQPQLPPAAGPVIPTIPGIEPAGVPSAAELQLSQQQKQLLAQQLQQQKQQVQSAMSGQASQLFSAWRPSNQNYEEGVPDKTLENGGPSSAGSTGFGQGGYGSAQNPNVLIKAGTILYAVLDTEVNSDEPGPVMATIVTGKLKGAKVIGSLYTFPPNGKKVMLNFNLMNMPSFPNSFTINAVAVDPDTARTALSSYTNSHLLLKYGGLFAASFLEGYGQAFLQSGQNVTSTASSTTVSSPDLSPAGKLYVALGNVGNAFGSQLQSMINTMPPTVHVYSGTGLGILFMQDLNEPQLGQPGSGGGMVPAASTAAAAGAPLK